MSSSNAGNGGSDDKNNRNKNKNKNKGKSSSSHITAEQKAYLEVFFEGCQHPDEDKQDHLAKVLGLQREQVAKWFHDKVSQSEPKFPTLENSHDEVPNSSRRSPTPFLVPDEAHDFLMEKSRMFRIAKAAYEELYKLLHNDSLWVRSSHDGRLVLDREKYKTTFPQDSDPNVFKTNGTREESSMSSTLLTTPAKKIVDALFDPKGLTELFPTMIQRAQIIKEYELGNENKHGALLLMYLEIHHLSHLVPPRKYFFLRYCEHVHGSGKWVISDVSIDSLGGNLPHLPSWKLPSGCLIHQYSTVIGTNATIVKWIEHVEVNDKPKNNLLYGDLTANNVPYSADRWIMILQRNNEKLYGRQIRVHGDISKKAQRSLLQISHEMTQNFCEILNMSCKPEITHLFESSNNNDEIKYSLRKNSAPGHPIGIIATLVTSFWIPLNYNNVFGFLSDVNKRNQWDPLCSGHHMYEVANVRIGYYFGNRVSVLRKDWPVYELTEKDEMTILQESSLDPMEGYIVYAPIESKNMHSLLMGTQSATSNLRVLPSGFAVTADADSIKDLFLNRPTRPNQDQQGSLVTMACQVLVSTTPSSIKDLNLKDLEGATTIFRTMIDNIKLALGSNR